MWFDILKKEVAKKGLAQVAKELGVGESSVSLLVSGKYNASTENMQKRVENIYGNGGYIHCPVLDKITPDRCAETWQRAKLIGMKAGNPETLRLYRQCLKCPIRK